MTQLDWETSSFNDAQKASIVVDKPDIAVSDGYVCSVAFMPRGMNIGAALEDYAKGYDSGGAESFSVTWKVFKKGVEDNRGTRRF